MKTNLQKIIEEARATLLDNKHEWEMRFAGYADKIQANTQKILDAKAQFHQWDPLYVYMSVNSAKSGMAFDLRFQGQSVASIISKNGVASLSVTTVQNRNNEKHFDFSVQDNNLLFNTTSKNFSAAWRSPEAASFRKHFMHIKTKAELSARQEEHRLESQMLSALEKNTAKNKVLLRIQPVKIAEFCRFQMPTPLTASHHQKGASYTKNGNGGGIDILARVGVGRGTQLCIIELKRSPCSGSNSLLFPQKVMGQALAYAVFMQELLASTSGRQWYSIFGFSGALPAKPTLKVCIVMPDNERYPLIEEQISTDKGAFDLRCVYLEEDWKNGIKVKRATL